MTEAQQYIKKNVRAKFFYSVLIKLVLKRQRHVLSRNVHRKKRGEVVVGNGLSCL